MKLRYYLIPMHKAAAWQVVGGDCEGIDYFHLNKKGGVDVLCFPSNTERDEWIAAVHKHLAEWAYGKEEVPEAVREADEIISDYSRNSIISDRDIRYSKWRYKWMKPGEPKHLGDYLYEV